MLSIGSESPTRQSEHETDSTLDYFTPHLVFK